MVGTDVGIVANILRVCATISILSLVIELVDWRVLARRGKVHGFGMRLRETLCHDTANSELLSFRPQLPAVKLRCTPSHDSLDENFSVKTSSCGFIPKRLRLTLST